MKQDKNINCDSGISGKINNQCRENIKLLQNCTTEKQLLCKDHFNDLRIKGDREAH